MKKNIIITILSLALIFTTIMWVITQNDFEGMQELFNQMQELLKNCHERELQLLL
jgi:hypothetical protein